MGFRARILGAAAGGGLPQWNCGCLNCNLAREGVIPSMTQSSMAVCGHEGDWSILNASPDVRVQLSQAQPLSPVGLRQVPIHTVLLTNGDIDHIAGLLSLREMQPFRLLATQEILNVLAANPIFDALNPSVVSRVPIALNDAFELVSGVEATLFAVPGKVPLYLEGDTVETDLIGEQTVGVALTTREHRVFYIPGCALMNDDLRARLKGADMIFFDGTLWSDDEMQTTGVGQKTGKRMGHMSMSGEDGSIAAFVGMDIGQKVYVHMNNTNPVVRPDSDERAAVMAAGWVVAQDGMEFSL
ncbi:MAG: pyrroloquinoline quinone biosynthesis protein PqqB [Pseudomonadota bacterium]